METLSPWQMDGGDASTPTVGVGLTVTRIVVVSAQFVPSVPMSVYVVDDDGATTMDVVVALPGIQVYDVAPLAVSVVVVPEQTVDDVAEAPTVIGVPNVIDAVVVVVQPLKSVTVHVYVPTPSGVSVCAVPPDDHA